MKKTIVYLLLIIFSIMTIIGCSNQSKSSMTGIYLKCSNGNNIIIDEDNSPIVMNNKTGKENIFDDLISGDKIEIDYDSIAESYPAQTQIYNCILKEKGSMDNISNDIIDRLQEMGWNFDLSK